MILRPSFTPWHPSMIATVATWESDVGLTQSDNLVSAWTDTRGAYTLSASGTARPTLSGGRIIFDGVNDALTSAAGPTVGTGAVRIMLLGSLSSSAAEDLPMYIGTLNSSKALRALYRASSGTTINVATWANDKASTLGWDLGADHVFVASFDGTSSTAASAGRDGTYQALTLAATPLTPSTGISIGGGSASAPYWSALSVRAALVCVGALSQADIDRLDGWAAWKLGTQALLPANHPYRYAPPLA